MPNNSNMNTSVKHRTHVEPAYAGDELKTRKERDTDDAGDINSIIRGKGQRSIHDFMCGRLAVLGSCCCAGKAITNIQ